jgi:hypothetical protein
MEDLKINININRADSKQLTDIVNKYKLTVT